MKEFNCSFSTESKTWKIAFVFFWVALLIWNVIGEHWFWAGFSTCALIDSVFRLIAFLYDSHFEKEDEE